MENDRIAKSIYVGESVDSCSVRRHRKRWIDTVKECFKIRGLGVRPARRMVHDRNAWWGFVRGNAWGIAWGMNI